MEILNNSDPSEKEKSDYVKDRTATRNEIFTLKIVAEKSLNDATSKANKIAPLMILDKTVRALHQEEQIHRSQLNKMRLHDIKSVKIAAKYAESITLIDEISRPDIKMYLKKEPLTPHTKLSREVIKKLFS